MGALGVNETVGLAFVIVETSEGFERFLANITRKGGRGKVGRGGGNVATTKRRVKVGGEGRTAGNRFGVASGVKGENSFETIVANGGKPTEVFACDSFRVENGSNLEGKFEGGQVLGEGLQTLVLLGGVNGCKVFPVKFAE